MKSKSSLILILFLILHFLLAAVLGATFGIYACVASFAVLSVLVIYRHMNESNDCVPVSGIKCVLFSALSFSGALLVALALRQLFEALFPLLSYRLNVMVLTRSDFLSIGSALYIVFSSLALGLIPVFEVGRGMSGKSNIVRYVSAGLLTGLFSMNVPSFFPFVLFGILALYLYQNGVGTPYIIFYSLLFSIISRLIDFSELIAETSYGAALGLENSFAMLLLFLGVAVVLTSCGRLFISDKEKRQPIFIIMIAGLLITVIGCATVQYFNR